jgi:hypothetical protein
MNGLGFVEEGVGGKEERKKEPKEIGGAGGDWHKF